MKFYKSILSLVIAVGFFSITLNAQEQDRSQVNQELNDRDLQALKQFVNSKRTMDLLEKVRNLTLSGDVRTEWRRLNEFVDGRNIRVGGFKDKNNLPISQNDFDMEANIRLEYRQENAWAVSQLRFDNTAGIDNTRCFCSLAEMNDGCKKCQKCKKQCLGFGCYQERFHGSGFAGNIALRRAFMGYNVMCNDYGRLDVELGRRHLYDVFESEIQFLSRFDGVFVKYSRAFEWVKVKWYWNTAGFIVDERVNYYNWASETGFMDIMEAGIDLKYSYIDWVHHQEDRCGVKNPAGFDYRISQVTASYHVNEDFCINGQTELYGAFLFNHQARKQNTGWYIGLYVGDVYEAGDWSADLQYQWVEPKAIAFDDQAGIGLGNVLDEQCGRNLTTGFQGWRLDMLYALTDNLTLQMVLESTNDLHASKVCQPTHKYNKIELEAVYAF